MEKLRSGFTTGACAAAAAKGAALYLLTGALPKSVEIPFPDGIRRSFLVESVILAGYNRGASAGVIKDAGDDPDVTNGAMIAANAILHEIDDTSEDNIVVTGGTGVGTVTKPGLAVPVGQPAINPVPMQMIVEAVREALAESPTTNQGTLRIEIVVPKGLALAEKTLNGRLGIVGGISILGTTGIVKPVSADAWTATISTSMDVAAAAGCTEIILSTGRTSEAALLQLERWPDEAFVMMGDYLEFSLKESARHQFTRLHIAAMWGKTLKAAMRVPQTHVRFGALELGQAVELLQLLAPEKDLAYLAGVNTAREIYERLNQSDDLDLVEKVCDKARQYQAEVAGLPVSLYLVHHDKTIKVISEDGRD